MSFEVELFTFWEIITSLPFQALPAQNVFLRKDKKAFPFIADLTK